MIAQPNLNIQVCFYPLFNGGLYLTFSWSMKMLRVSLGVIDFRLWWDHRPEHHPFYKENTNV
jgi:hypothetical protein